MSHEHEQYEQGHEHQVSVANGYAQHSEAAVVHTSPHDGSISGPICGAHMGGMNNAAIGGSRAPAPAPLVTCSVPTNEQIRNLVLLIRHVWRQQMVSFETDQRYAMQFRSLQEAEVCHEVQRGDLVTAFINNYFPLPPFAARIDPNDFRTLLAPFVRLPKLWHQRSQLLAHGIAQAGAPASQGIAQNVSQTVTGTGPHTLPETSFNAMGSDVGSRAGSRIGHRMGAKMNREHSQPPSQNRMCCNGSKCRLFNEFQACPFIHPCAFLVGKVCVFSWDQVWRTGLIIGQDYEWVTIALLHERALYKLQFTRRFKSIVERYSSHRGGGSHSPSNQDGAEEERSGEECPPIVCVRYRWIKNILCQFPRLNLAAHTLHEQHQQTLPTESDQDENGESEPDFEPGSCSVSGPGSGSISSAPSLSIEHAALLAQLGRQTGMNACNLLAYFVCDPSHPIFASLMHALPVSLCHQYTQSLISLLPPIMRWPNQFDTADNPVYANTCATASKLFASFNEQIGDDGFFDWNLFLNRLTAIPVNENGEEEEGEEEKEEG